MKVNTSIDINAPASKIWQVLTDLEAYKTWNSFITEASGEVAVGNTATIFCKPKKDSSGLSFKVKILKVDPDKELRWLGHLFGIPGLFSGNHLFLITDLGAGRVRLDQSETFTGILAPVLECFTSVAKDLEEAFSRFDLDLKTMAEVGHVEKS